MTLSAANFALPELEARSPMGRIHTFARLLRDNGFLISQSDVADAITCLTNGKIMDEAHCRRVLQALFCKRASERERFAEIFDAFWLGQVGRKRTVKRNTSAAQSKSILKGDTRVTGGAKGLIDYIEWAGAQEAEQTDPENGTPEGDATRLAGRSQSASRHSADFGRMTDPDEREILLALAERLAARLRYRLSRRRKLQLRGHGINVRATLRKSLATGGLPITLLRRTRKKPPVNLIFFVDVSGSMDAYSLFFTRFAHAMTGHMQRAETFIFHTRLVHISRAFRDAHPNVMMEKLALISQGWSGGTKIGDALATFNADYARLFADARTIAIIMSDGYDTSPAGMLDAEVRRLKSRCHKIIWLNPMLGRASYQPETDAMTSVLPHLDAFLPAHNLRSLTALEDALVRA